VVSLVLGPDGGAAPFVAAMATGHPDRFKGFMSWSTPTFEVTSAEPIELGLDGETMVMDSPLEFSMRPQPVRVRLPQHAIGYSPAALSIGWRESLRELWGVVLGRPSRFRG
jgi:diacylglycerol kinase family enzyme